MRVVGKARAGLNAEMVEHQEGREVAQLRCTDGSAHTGARALGLFNREKNFANRAGDRHISSCEVLGRISKVW